jgi:DNA-binding GntR family transcriptional regulator
MVSIVNEPSGLTDAQEADRVPTASGSATDFAYSRILDLILSRDLRPGERTSVNLLVARLKLGRAPIREAISRLHAEGVLIIKKQSGTTVAAVDGTGAIHLFALRGALEDLAAKTAVENATKDDFARVKFLLAEMKETSITAPRDRGAGARFVKANSAFHAAIVASAHNPYLDQAYSRLQLQFQIVSYLSYRGYDPVAAALRQAEHEEIGAALIARNALHLRDSQRNHSASTERSLLHYLSPP